MLVIDIIGIIFNNIGMTDPEGLSCYECPTVCEINRMFAESAELRRATEQKTVDALGEFEQIDPNNEDAQALRERWAATSEQIFTKLDRANDMLTTNLVALLETCDDMKPHVVRELGGSALHCSSKLAAQVAQNLYPSTEQ